MTPTLRLRAGYAYTQAAAPDETVTPLLPEARRNHVTAGVGWSPRPGMTVDLAYQFIAHADRRGRTVNPPPGERPTVALNSGAISVARRPAGPHHHLSALMCRVYSPGVAIRWTTPPANDSGVASVRAGIMMEETSATNGTPRRFRRGVAAPAAPAP